MLPSRTDIKVVVLKNLTDTKNRIAHATAFPIYGGVYAE